MNRNAVRASPDDQSRKLCRFGVGSVSGISNQGDLVKVNAEVRHGAILLTESNTIGVTGTS